VSKDPDFAAKVVDIVGLYLDPPGGAVALAIDEKTQVQALADPADASAGLREVGEADS
jgi:hypothetical protein